MSATDMPPPVLQARGVSKSFGPVKVLRDVSFDVRPGEIHALVGENGAGKSTLSKILGGVYQPDSGTVLVGGAERVLANPVEARRAGIAVIHQEPALFPSLTVAENIFAGRELRNRAGLVDWPAMQRQTRQMLDRMELPIRPEALVATLSVAERQMVDMVRALSEDPSILIIDEPTASLTPREVEDLFRALREQRKRGNGIVFISHRLNEILQISDRVTVLRDGAVVGELQSADADEPALIRLMVGRDVSTQAAGEGAEAGEVMLAVRGLARAGEFSDVSFEVRAGEIAGIGGLVGAGRTELAETIFGARRPTRGTVEVGGKTIRRWNSREAIRNQVVYVPEDRHKHGLTLTTPISENVALPVLGKLARFGWLRPERERRLATEHTQRLRLVARSVRQAPRELSGGNQQKVVIAKWLTVAPRVLILDEPSRGVDVGARAEIHAIIRELAASGVAVLVISSDLPELLALSHTVHVMREGRMVAHFPGADATPELVMTAAIPGQASS